MKPNLRTRNRPTRRKPVTQPAPVVIHPKRKRRSGRTVRIVRKPKLGSSLLRQLQTRPPANPIPPAPVRPAGDNRHLRPPSSPQPSNRQPQRVSRPGLLDAARGDAGRTGKGVASCAGCFMALVLLGVVSFAVLFGTFAYSILSNF